MAQRKLMAVQGMTCADCQSRVADALVRAGAGQVSVDYRRGELALDPRDADESRLRGVVEDLGYRAGSLGPIPAAVASEAQRPGSWGFLLLLLPAICCAPLLLVAIGATGVGAWLGANRVLLGSLLTLGVAVVFVGLWVRRGGVSR